MSEKIYCNELVMTEKEMPSGGTILNVWIPSAVKLTEFLAQHSRADGSMRLTISRKKDPAPKKPTHYAVLDTWEPRQQSAQPAAAPTGNANSDNIGASSLPF